MCIRDRAIAALPTPGERDVYAGVAAEKSGFKKDNVLLQVEDIRRARHQMCIRDSPSPNRAAPSSERAALPVWAVRLSISFAAIQGATVTSPAERLPSPSAISAR